MWRYEGCLKKENNSNSFKNIVKKLNSSERTRDIVYEYKNP